MEHWSSMARQWARLGAPLRPSPEDVASAAAEVAGARRGLVLGVTPELIALPWPGPVIAIDRSRGMIGALAAGRPTAVGDWCALPLADASIDLAVGDGCLSCLRFPDGYRVLAGELARVLAPGGRVHLRLFASPARGEPVVETDSFHHYKWRLAMALALDDRHVRVADIWRAFAEREPDRDALARRTGWRRDVIDTIDAYRDSPAVYSFPTVGEAEAALAPLRVLARRTPSYPLGERCPSIVLGR